MKRDNQLTDLANDLRYLKVSAPLPMLLCDPPNYCHRVSGNVWRVCRAINGTMIIFGVSADIGIAALFADAMTRNLWPYHSDLDEVASSVLNYECRDMSSYPEITSLARRVMQHLEQNQYLGDLEKIREARRINFGIIADLERKLDSVKDELHRANKSFDKLFKL